MSSAVFLHGSTMRHVLVMTASSATGLLAMFGVDMVDMYFLTLLGEQELAAAVGYAGTLMFFLVSVSIGMQIALGCVGGTARKVLTAVTLRLATAPAACCSIFWYQRALSLVFWLNLRYLLTLLGASGQTLEYAVSYSNILLPNTPVLMLGMACTAGIRAIGDARRSMWATVAGSLVNAVLDPIFIFTFEWGLEGAALASVAARWTLFGIATYALIFIHGLPRRIQVWLNLLPICGPYWPSPAPRF